MKNFQDKTRFLNTLQPLEQILIGDMFEKISLFEDKFDKDCSEFDPDDIKKFFEKYLPPSEAQLKVWCQLLQKYVDFTKDIDDVPKEYYAQYDESVALISSQILKKGSSPKRRVIDFSIIYGEAEFGILRNKLLSRYDKLILQALYEGFDFVENCRDYLVLSSEHCDLDTNTVYFPSGRELEVSRYLMNLLLECANNNSYTMNGTKRTRRCEGHDKTSKICFKNLQISPDMDDAQLRKKFISKFRKLKEALGDEKLSQYSLRMSGYLNGLLALGIVENFDNPKILDKPEIYKWAQRYQLADKTRVDYRRMIRRCLVDVD